MGREKQVCRNHFLRAQSRDSSFSYKRLSGEYVTFSGSANCTRTQRLWGPTHHNMELLAALTSKRFEVAEAEAEAVRVVVT